MKNTTDSPELQYISRIHNLGKHNYAIEFLYFLRGWRDTEPSYKDYNLSYMAGQAVRTELYSLNKS